LKPFLSNISKIEDQRPLPAGLEENPAVTASRAPPRVGQRLQPDLTAAPNIHTVFFEKAFFQGNRQIKMVETASNAGHANRSGASRPIDAPILSTRSAMPPLAPQT
jgi:hypothetical protein